MINNYIQKNFIIGVNCISNPDNYQTNIYRKINILLYNKIKNILCK